MVTSFNAYTIDLGDQEAALRLTARGLINLKKKLKVDSDIECITSGIDDIENMITILTEALNYKGNENTITDGADLYDAMVDAGYHGIEEFVPVLTDIGFFSGILSEKMKSAIDAKAKGLAEDQILLMEAEAKKENDEAKNA